MLLTRNGDRAEAHDLVGRSNAEWVGFEREDRGCDIWVLRKTAFTGVANALGEAICEDSNEADERRKGLVRQSDGHNF